MFASLRQPVWLPPRGSHRSPACGRARRRDDSLNLSDRVVDLAGEGFDRGCVGLLAGLILVMCAWPTTAACVRGHAALPANHGTPAAPVGAGPVRLPHASSSEASQTRLVFRSMALTHLRPGGPAGLFDGRSCIDWCCLAGCWRVLGGRVRDRVWRVGRRAGRLPPRRPTVFTPSPQRKHLAAAGTAVDRF
jgi:hypothetical protein